jgi:hypothetical protein
MLTRELCNGHVDVPLSPLTMDVCLTALDYIIKALKGEESKEDESEDENGEIINSGVVDNDNSGDNSGDNSDYDDDNDNGNNNGDENEGGDNDDSGYLTEFVSSLSAPPSTHPTLPSTHHHTPSTTPKPTNKPTIKPTQKTVSLEDLLPLFLPDQRCILHSSVLLNVDDAPWISATLLSDGDSTMKLVHSRISPLDALLLGALSLKGLYLSGEEVLCPNPRGLNDCLLHDSVNEVLRDLVSMANNLNASSIEVLYDQRTHPVERLMHPGLAQAQGPAITVYIECSSLDAEGVCRLIEEAQTFSGIIEEDRRGGGLSYLNSMDAFASSSLHGMNSRTKKTSSNNNNSNTNNNDSYYHSNSGGGSNNNYASVSSNDNDVINAMKQYPRTGGKRLMTAFAITDCLQVVTGRDLFIFDPLGSHLITGDENTDPAGDSTNGRTRSQSRVQSGSYQSTDVGQGGGRGSAARGGRSTSIGQHYDLGGSRNSAKKGSKESSKEDILAQFPDQFSSLVNLPFGAGSKISSGSINGIIIRMVMHLLYL